MATGSFRVKTNNEWNTIYYRFKQSKIFDIECSTNLKIPNKRWSSTKSEVLPTKDFDSDKVNLDLKDLDRFIIGEYNKDLKSGINFNSKWLKEKINKFFNRETKNELSDNIIFFTNYINTFIEESKTKKTRNNTPIKPRTIQHYNTTLSKIKSFEDFKSIKLRISDIDLKFHNSFIEFLDKQQKLNPNTIGGYVDDIKLMINYADKKGIEINKEAKFNEFYTPTNKTKDIYLKEEEINKIFNHKFDLDHLDNARDWFIIGLRTGLRISDFLKLTNKNLVDGFIEKNTIKTDFPVIIPIHEQVQFILDKRNGKFPREISDQKFNDYIKKVCEEVGISEEVEGARMDEIITKKDGKKEIIYRKKAGMYKKHELVSSHICRRSFATNLYGKIDTLTIMKITGHKTEAQFLSYIKITPKEYAEKLKAYWKNAPKI
ncbi:MULTISPECIES: site-specific integrase [unclassified Flavobacterium]|uniref:site-specific integrase n=1 Tax=unclassified Flavobacterium TaxID=196869 RepID=UPI001290FEA8|nr:MULTISPECIES: site-specific integrase [unclassified Flavobacterium]MQP52683.1 integrase [Flavobacterium sp. LMO9]MQP62137.1 integrase [Flavobacterium sp. LMO6]